MTTGNLMSCLSWGFTIFPFLLGVLCRVCLWRPWSHCREHCGECSSTVPVGTSLERANESYISSLSLLSKWSWAALTTPTATQRRLWRTSRRGSSVMRTPMRPWMKFWTGEHLISMRNKELSPTISSKCSVDCFLFKSRCFYSCNC